MVSHFPIKRPFSNSTPLIAAIMKEETPYIVEWVAWHKLQGFDLMVGDNCTEGTQTELLKRLERIGLIACVDCRNIPRPPQLPAYRKMLLRAFLLGYRFIGFMDGDEFFEPLGNGQSGADLVRDTLSRKGIHACGYRWAIFGSSGHERASAEPVMIRFTRRAPPLALFADRPKSFARISSLVARRPRWRSGKFLLFGIIGPHHFHLPTKRYLIDGVSGSSSADGVCGWKNARIRHYAVKSREECRFKARRGDVFYETNKYADDAYWRRYDLNDIEDPLAPELQRALLDKIAEIERALAADRPQAK